MSDPKFKRRIHAEQKVRLREMRDGCVDCLALKGYCSKHHKEAMQLILHPKEYLAEHPLPGT